MKAVQFKQFGPSSVLELVDVPVPSPQANEVLIKIRAAGVNPVDWKIREGYLENTLPHEFPIIPGWDAAGVVEEVGLQATHFSPGDEVYAYCRKGRVQWGSYAEYMCLEESSVALKPKSLSFMQSAALPLVTLTAWQSLVDFANIKEGMSVLIHAGAGGVGSMGIQIAKLKGATVYTTASSRHNDYLRDLGADHIIDYTQTDFTEEMHKYCPDGVDVIFDCVGGETLQRSFALVKKGGVLVTIVEFQIETMTKGQDFTSGAVFVSPSAEELSLFAKYFDNGTFKIPAIEGFPLQDAAKVQDRVKQGHTQGKLVLQVS